MLREAFYPTDRAGKLGVAAGAVVGVLPALFFGVVIGGSFGGASGAWIAERVLFGQSFFIPLGIALGFGAVFSIILVGAALLGRLLAAAVMKTGAV